MPSFPRDGNPGVSGRAAFGRDSTANCGWLRPCTLGPFRCSCKESNQRKHVARNRRPFPLRLRLRGKVQGAHPCAPVRFALPLAALTPALLAESGLARRHFPLPAGSCAPPRAHSLRTRSYFRLRLRCSAAATGTKIQIYSTGESLDQRGRTHKYGTTSNLFCHVGNCYTLYY